MWASRFVLYENDLSQVVHWYGFLSVWVRMCMSRRRFCENNLKCVGKSNFEEDREVYNFPKERESESTRCKESIYVNLICCTLVWYLTCWVRMCLAWSCFVENYFWHVAHSYIFVPVWIHRCQTRLYFCEHTLGRTHYLSARGDSFHVESSPLNFLKKVPPKFRFCDRLSAVHALLHVSIDSLLTVFLFIYRYIQA